MNSQDLQPACALCGTKHTLKSLHGPPPWITQMYPEQTVFLCRGHRSAFEYQEQICALVPRRRYLDNRRFQKSESQLHDLLKDTFSGEMLLRNIRPLWALSNHGRLLEFDICIPKHRILVEYDGRQHSEYVPFMHKTPQKFRAQVERDVKKEALATTYGWTLVRFDHNDVLSEEIVQQRLQRYRSNG